MATWRLFVIHPDRRRFIDFISENHSDSKIVWDGRDPSGNTLETGTTYNIVVQAIDGYGNTGTIYNTLAVTPGAVVAPVTVSLDGGLIGESQVYFPANSADMSQVDADKARSNTARSTSWPACSRVRLGRRSASWEHANQVLWQDAAKAQYEQAETLDSTVEGQGRRRAGRAQDPWARFPSLRREGVGSEGNVVPFSDYDNIWKNRRVEFLIER